MKIFLLLAQADSHLTKNNHLTSTCLVFTVCKTELITIQASSFPLRDSLRIGEIPSWKWLELLRTGLSIQKRVVLRLGDSCMKGGYCEVLLGRRKLLAVAVDTMIQVRRQQLHSLMALISLLNSFFLISNLSLHNLLWIGGIFFLPCFLQQPGHLEKNKTSPRHKYIFS